MFNIKEHGSDPALAQAGITAGVEVVVVSAPSDLVNERLQHLGTLTLVVVERPVVGVDQVRGTSGPGDALSGAWQVAAGGAAEVVVSDSGNLTEVAVSDSGNVC